MLLNCTAQSAAAEVAAHNPEGIDYLIVNAGVNDVHVAPSLDMCAGCARTARSFPRVLTC